jgi:hypothetical protein
MPRPLLPFAAAAMLGIAPVLMPPPAWAAEPLTGWGGYKFGMSPDQARAVPGQVFGPYAPRNLWNENKGAMGAKKESQLYGQSWALNLFFDAYNKLNGISLEYEKKTTSRATCEQNFLSALAETEKTYGALAAVNPERKWVATDTPPTQLEWRAQGASHYQFAAVSFAEEYGFAWKARKSQGANYVELATTWSGKPDDKANPCVVNISFQGK